MSTPAIDTSRTSERLSAFQSEIHSNTPVDNIFVELPTLSMIMKNRKVKAFGRQIMVPLDTAVNDTVKSFADTEAFSTTVPNTARTAVYPAKNYGGALVYTWEELRENVSDNRIFDLVAHRRKNLMGSLKDLINSDLYQASPGANDFHSLPQIISTSRSLGGINSTTNSYWDAQETTSVGAFSSNGISNMRTMMNDLKATGAGTAKMVVTTQSILEAYENEIDVDIRYQQSGKLERGASSLYYRGAEVTFDDDCTSGHMYFVHPDWLEFWVDEAGNFNLGEVRESIDSMVYVAKLVLRGQVLSSQPRGLGRLTGIS